MKRFQRVSLRRQKSRFLARRSPQTKVLFEYVRDYCAGRPSIWYWRDHSAGKPVRRATPMPWGSLPSMAALTRSGARKASEIVMLIFRALHRSRFAMRSALAVGSSMSSSSQRRPRAIAATSLARVSERIGRACSGRIPSGRRISRRRLAGIFRQGTARVFGGSPSWMINWSGWTSTRTT
jgi:hypothetical protein